MDEADDRTREMYKTNAKLQKKVAKMERQLTSKPAAPAVEIPHTTDDITRRNTIANEIIPVVTTSMAPPPLPFASKISANPAVGATPTRQPLRPVANIFEATTPSIVGAKRAREVEADAKPPQVDFITFPPTSAAPPPSSAKRTPGRQGFTPTRGNAFRPTSAGAAGDAGAAGRPLAKNAFARPASVGGVFGVGSRDTQL